MLAKSCLTIVLDRQRTNQNQRKQTTHSQTNKNQTTKSCTGAEHCGREPSRAVGRRHDVEAMDAWHTRARQWVQLFLTMCFVVQFEQVIGCLEKRRAMQLRLTRGAWQLCCFVLLGQSVQLCDSVLRCACNAVGLHKCCLTVVLNCAVFSGWRKDLSCTTVRVTICCVVQFDTVIGSLEKRRATQLCLTSVA